MRYLFFILFTSIYPIFLFCDCENFYDETIEKLLEVAFECNPTLDQIYARVQEGLGNYEESSGEFDYNLGWNTSYNAAPTPSTSVDIANGLPKTVWEHSATAELFFSKKMRSGMSIQPSVSFSRVQDSNDQEAGINRGRVALNMEIPLLRGSGQISVGALEKAALLQYQGLCLSWPQLVSEVITQIVDAFLSYQSFYQQMRILEESVERAEQLASETEQLVDAQQLPTSDYLQAKASLASRQNQKLAIKQQWLRAKHNLYRLIGTTEEEGCFEIPYCPLLLPSSKEVHAFVSYGIDCYIYEALSFRGDYLGRQKFVDASERLLYRAKNNLKPELNLLFELSKSGLEEGKKFHDYWSSIDNKSRGLGLLAQLNYTFPVCNKQAKGQYLRQRADLSTQKANLNELKYSIISQVQNAYSDIVEHKDRFFELSLAASEYFNAVSQEKERFSEGITTIIDVIELDSRYINSLLDKERQKLEYIRAILQMKQALGAILDQKKGGICINTPSLLKLPTSM